MGGVLVNRNNVVTQMTPEGAVIVVIHTRLHVLFEQESKPAAGNALSCKFSQVQENNRARPLEEV